VRQINGGSLFFIVALLLAWPTLGLSLLAWIGWIFWIGWNRARKSENSEILTARLEPVFDDDYALFANNLSLPYHDHVSIDEILQGDLRSNQDLHQIGRLIMKYLSNNPREADRFMVALEVHGTASAGNLTAPHEALDWEFQDKRRDGPLKLVSLRAVEALMTNNDLRCFRSVDLTAVSEMVNELTAWERGS